jgi:hypothetical protein
VKWFFALLTGTYSMTAPVAWPITLPQQPASYSEQDKDIVVRTQPDSGPTKGRLRFTKAGTLGQMEFLFTIFQREAMRYFYETQLKRGSVQMIFTHPWTLLSTVMTITQPPKYSSDGPLGVRCTFPVEFFAAAAASPTAGQIVVTATQSMPVVTQQGLIDTTDSRHVSASQLLPAHTMSAQGRAFVRTSAAQAVLQLIQTATASVIAGETMLVGMNIGGTSDYSANIPFANLLRSMRKWLRLDDGSESTWLNQDQGQITTATTQRFGSVVITPEAGLTSQTLRVLNPNGNSIIVSGGWGDPGAGGAWTTATSFDYVYTAGTFVNIFANGNVSGTMAVLLEGHESSYTGGNEWASNFLAFHTTLGTKVLRFMDGSATNTTLDSTYADRTVTGKVSFQGSGGVQIPYEVQADLCNRLGADMWVSIPPRASTSTFTPSLASLLFSTLNVARKVYPERGNEVWNTFGSFAANTEWIRRNGHTRINYTTAGATFTKTTHGFSNNQLFQSFMHRDLSKVGVNAESQLVQLADNWVTAQAYTVGQYVRQGGEAYICTTAHTSGTFSTDLSSAKWAVTAFWPLCLGGKLYIKVLTADTFELWTGTGGTGIKCAAPPLASTMIGILSDEFGVIDENAELNTQYATLALADWTAFDTAFGGTTRVKATLGSQAAFAAAWTAQRLAVAGVAARCNHVAIAPYHNGQVWGGKITPAAGKITPFVWLSDNTSTFHCTVYTTGSTPTLAQRKAGTGTGFQTRLTPLGISANGRNFTQASDITIADGTYKVYMDLVDFFGYTWTIVNNVVVGAAQPTVDYIDTDANQQLRDLLNIDSGSGDIAFIQEHQALIAASSNPAITIVNYEGGSHQDYYPPDGGAIDTWYRAHRESAVYGETLRHYYNILAACGVKVHCHYMDVSGQGLGLADTPWRIATNYSDTADERFLAVATFGGLVPARTLVDFNTILGNTFSTAPAYPAVVVTFSDPSLTYSVLPKSSIEEGIFSVTGNVLSITSGGSINFAAPATQNVWIRATDGFTDAYFQVQFSTGDAWYSAVKQIAWTAVDDTSPAGMNLIDGNTLTPASTPATVVTGGWDLGGGANYQGGSGAAVLAYTSNPLFLIVSRVDNETGSYNMIVQFGNSAYLQFLSAGASNIKIIGDRVAETNFPYSDTLQVSWVWFDNTNLKYYYGTNQTVHNSGGTTYADPGSSSLGAVLNVGGPTTGVVVGGFESTPAADMATALSLVQKAQTKHGIA